MRRLWGPALAAGLAMLAGTAQAQPGIFAGGMCMALPGDMDGCLPAGSPCTADGGAPGTCERVGSTRFCRPNDALLCCGTDSDCPAAVGGLVGCVIGLGTGLCQTDGVDYCTGGVAPTTAEFNACHRDPARGLVVWDAGDCDGDGISNGYEVDRGTDPCLAPERKAIWTGSSCQELPTGCFPGDGCSTPTGDVGDCVVASDGSISVCVPRGPALFCGDGEWVCPAGQIEVEDIGFRHTFCSPPFCEPRETPYTCVHDTAGQPTAPENGDCDGDGILNGRELDGHVCSFDVGEPDAGINRPDGGITLTDAGDIGPDAGVGADASIGPTDSGAEVDGGGASADAGQDVPRRSGGGGGCACRATPGPKRPAGLFVLAGVALAFSSWRAARRARRTPRDR